MPSLEISGPGTSSTTYRWGQREKILTIGRDDAATIQIRDRNISRLHARILRVNDTWVIQDTQSKNGTKVNGAPVQERVLEHGDIIGLAMFSLTFKDPEGQKSDELLLQEAARSAGLGEDVERAGDLFVPETPPSAAGPADHDIAGMPGEKIEDADPKPAPLTEICSMTSVTIYDGNLPNVSMEVLKAANRKLLFLTELTSEGLQFSSIRELADFLQRRLCALLQASRAYLFGWSADQSTLFTPCEPKLEGTAARTPISNSLIDHARKEETAILVRNPSEDARFKDHPSMIQHGVISAICAPVHLAQTDLGFLYVDRLEAGHAFTRDDLEFVVAIANQTALLMHNFMTLAASKRDNEILTDELKGQFNIIGDSPALQEVFEFIEQASKADAGVLILGESGTGKELVARAIHYNSPRMSKRFVAVNCASITPSLFESELFGHVKGAFTGADKDRPGLFEEANGGTLLLDEIGELPPESQSKILRVLESGEIRRVGDSQDRKVDVRIIAATNRDLQEEVDAKAFRRDLYYRLNILTVSLPPLRERGDDIHLLIQHALADFSKRCGKRIRGIDDDVLALLVKHPWPGNVRELRNVMERMVVMCRGNVLTMKEVPFDLRQDTRATVSGASTPLITLEAIESRHILGVLEATGGNKKKTAEILGIDRSTLYKKLEHYQATRRHPSHT